MSNPVNIFQESQDSFIKSYYYVDSKSCKRSACKIAGAIVFNAEDFIAANKDIILLDNVKKDYVYISIITATDIETIASVFNTYRLENGAISSLMYANYVSSAYLIDIYVPVTVIMYDSFRFTGAIEEAGCSLFDTQYFCSYIAKEIGYCQNKKSAMISNVISRLDTGGYQYPSYPIIGHNCKQCGICVTSCPFAFAIKNSITRTATKIQNIDAEPNILSEITRSNQRVVFGEEIVVE